MAFDTRLRKKTHRAELLTKEQEGALARAIELGRQAQERIDQGAALAGDVDVARAGRVARRRFIEANLGLVVSVATRQLIPTHVDLDDVIHDGILGLGRAVDDFDPDLGWKFSTYAVWWIRRSIQVGLETQVASVRIPTHRLRDLRTAKAAPEVDELSLLQAQTQTMLHMRSLDVAAGDDYQTPMRDMIVCDDPQPESIFDALVDRHAVRELLAELDDENAELVIARFGLDGDAPRTYTEMAAERGVSPEAVRKRILRSLARMRPHAERLVAA